MLGGMNLKTEKSMIQKIYIYNYHNQDISSRENEFQQSNKWKLGVKAQQQRKNCLVQMELVSRSDCENIKMFLNSVCYFLMK